MTRMYASGDEHVQITATLESWLKSAGAPVDVAIDLADVSFAGCRVDAILREMVALNPSEPAARDRAADLIGELRSWLFDEIAYHLRELENRWTELEDAIEPAEG